MEQNFEYSDEGFNFENFVDNIQEEESDTDDDIGERLTNNLEDFEEDNMEDDEEDNVEQTQKEWKEKIEAQLFEEFSNHEGADTPLDETATHVDFFFLLFDERLQEHCVKNINSFAEEKRGEGNWEKVTSEEFRAYLACLLFAGLVRIPDWKDYWSYGMLQQIFLRKIFPRKRWIDISRYLHFEDNHQLDPDNVLAKIWTIYEGLQTNFKKYWYPYRNMTVDEGMIPFLGRVIFRQYVPRKPSSTGIKYWILVDERGYLWLFKVYTGAKRRKRKKKEKEKFLATNVVLEFEEQLPPGPYKFIMDNFFGSEDLGNILHSRGRKFVMNCKAKRPTYLFLNGLHLNINWPKKLERYEYNWVMRSPGFLALTWKDTKLVNFLTNCHQPNHTVQKKKAKTFNIPDVADDYRSNYHHGDNYDKNISIYRLHHKN